MFVFIQITVIILYCNRKTIFNIIETFFYILNQVLTTNLKEQPESCPVAQIGQRFRGNIIGVLISRIGL